MEIVVREVGGVVIPDIHELALGESAQAFKERINTLVVMQSRRQFVLNMSQVVVLDSSGLMELTKARVTIARHNGRLALSDMTDSVKKELHTTKLIHVFHVYDTEAEAVQSFAD